MWKVHRVDSLKIIFCIFVLFIHAYRGSMDDHFFITSYLSKTIADCAVPGFAIISSYLLYRRGSIDWRQNVRKKANSLLIPLICFVTLWIVMDCAKVYLLNMGGEANYLKFGVLDWLDAYFGLYASSDWKPALTVLWYIRDLFICNVLAVPIKKLVDRFPLPVLICTMVVWLSAVPSYGIHTYVLVFFILGYYVVKYNIGMDVLDGQINVGLAFLIYVLSSVVDFVADVPTIHRIFIIISLLFFLLLSRELERKCFSAMIDRVAPTTFFIYLTHRFVYSILDTVVRADSRGVAMAIYFAKPFVALAGGIGVYYLLSAFFPQILCFITGGRKIKRIISEKEI